MGPHDYYITWLIPAVSWSGQTWPVGSLDGQTCCLPPLECSHLLTFSSVLATSIYYTCFSYSATPDTRFVSRIILFMYRKVHNYGEFMKFVENVFNNICIYFIKLKCFTPILEDGLCF